MKNYPVILGIIINHYSNIWWGDKIIKLGDGFNFILKFIFNPIPWGFMIQFDQTRILFSDGLKPQRATRKRLSDVFLFEGEKW